MKFKDITCVSDIYYVIGRWFTILMFVIAFATVPFALNKWDSIFTFLMCAALGFVGCAANYKDKTEYPVHYISACVSGICAVIWTIHLQPWCLLIMLLALVALFDKERWLLWCEIPCLIMVYVVLFI